MRHKHFNISFKNTFILRVQMMIRGTAVNVDMDVDDDGNDDDDDDDWS